MKIRNTITWIFTLLTGSLLLLAFIIVYYFSYQYTQNEFYQRLDERANIAAQSFLEKDELNTNFYEKIRKKHLQTLPDEQETILRVNISEKKIEDTSSLRLPAHFLQRIFDKKKAILKIDDFFYVGILYTDNEGDFLVVVRARNLYGLAKMKVLINILVLSFLGGVVATYLVGKYYAGEILKPISAMNEKANMISVSNLHLRLKIKNTKDELDELAITFNNMLDRLETAFDVQNNFIGNASHELRNPLTAILGETEIALSKERTKSEYQHSLTAVQKEAQRLHLLVNSLLKLAQTGMENKQLGIESVRVDELLLQLREHMDNIYPDHQVCFDFSELPDQAELLVVEGNQSLLMIALNNIVDNACKFSQNQKVIIKIVATKTAVDITVKDQGVGIPPADLKNITEPFFRAPNARIFKGFGIGLSLSHRIIKLHQGIIDISSEEKKGTIVKISLPHQRQPVATSSKILI